MNVPLAAELMRRFAERTGLASRQPPRRYLWTDAFAVCNWLGLAKARAESVHLELALKLVDQVHHVLGRHRGDDGRRGWLSGLSDVEGERHPTRAGLRIGKPLPERRANEPYDPRLEWERDGQYFHYLTRWMHALELVAGATGQEQFHRWALELAEAAFTAFVDRSGARMVWKMSIDLTRPLVPSMGHDDPLDGFVVASRLRAEAIAAGYAKLLHGRDWTSDDALGIGGLLTDALELELLSPGAALGAELLAAAGEGLRLWLERGDLGLPPHHRLAFRELGLGIGLHAVERLRERRVAIPRELLAAVPLAAELEATWSDPRQRESPAWLEHADINDVMLATSLAPDGYLATALFTR